MSEPIWQLEYEDTSESDDLDPDWWWTGYIDAPSLNKSFNLGDANEDDAAQLAEVLNQLHARIAELEAAINRAVGLLVQDENASPYIDQSLDVLLQALVGGARKPGVTTTKGQGNE